MKGLVAAFLDLLFPPRCVFCRALLPSQGNGVCGACQSELPWLVGSAAEQKGEFYHGCVSPLRYQGKVRASIQRYKFKGMRGYAGPYGKLLAQCIRDRLAGEFDQISWTPLSWKRKRERGYDQAYLLARVVAEELGCPIVATLRKQRHTHAQSGLQGAAERRANVLGAYVILKQAQIADQCILLIDDVITSGSTLSECARILRTAGAKRVVCATLARAR